LFSSQEQSEVTLSIPTQKAWINGDKEMLLRVFNNIIANGVQAVPFDHQAMIQLTVIVQEEIIEIFITDNGTGISDEQLPRIFEPYFTTKSTGTGLGLAMVKQIVESHNGSIRVTATSTAGTTISLVFPLLH
jgi:signal transduction histidine kinase